MSTIHVVEDISDHRDDGNRIEPGAIYRNEAGTQYAISPDGTGFHFYDSLEELHADQ